MNRVTTRWITARFLSNSESRCHEIASEFPEGAAKFYSYKSGSSFSVFIHFKDSVDIGSLYERLEKIPELAGARGKAKIDVDFDYEGKERQLGEYVELVKLVEKYGEEGISPFVKRTREGK